MSIVIENPQEWINPYDLPRKHTIKVEFTNGDIIEQEIEGTVDEVVDGYIGREFGQHLKFKGSKIWFWDGEVYLQHKKQYIEGEVI